MRRGTAGAVSLAWTSSHSASWSVSSPCPGASSLSASGCDAMTTLYATGAVIAVALLVYLLVALLAPEKF